MTAGSCLAIVAIQVHEMVETASVAEVSAAFSWSQLMTYDINAPGHNHSVLLATRGWSVR